MITSKILSKQKKIKHGFFNRIGGKSSGIYKSLNCGPGSNDFKSKIKENLKIVKNRINKKSKNIFLMHQMHSNKIFYINKNFKFSKKKIQADAVITDQKKIPIAILTADCAPILLYDKKKIMIAAIHAGWKGAYKDIITKVIKFMINKGCKEKNIIATIGPCIQVESYNVKVDFLKKFLKKDKKNKVFFKKRINKKSKNIFLMHQMHSNKIFYINKNFKFSKKKIQADAVITDQKKIPIAILTADCAPILLYDKKKIMIAAIHAGWKGAYKDIITKVIKFMLNKGCKEKNIIATIGPCIQVESYNVKVDFLKKFLKKDKKNKVFFKDIKNSLHFNLPNFIKSRLKSNKISNIEAIKIDTFDDKNNFFSARRSLRLKHADYGRNISIIMIN